MSNKVERPSKIIRQDEIVTASLDITKRDCTLIRRAIYHERRKSYPALPKSLNETLDVLRTLDVSTSQKEDLLLYCDRADGTPLVIFSCYTNLLHLCNAQTILGDGTFRYCPKFFLQIYTIHAVINQHFVPLVFALLPDKTEATYTKMLCIIRDTCRDLQFNFAPTSIMLDFEFAVHNAVRNMFPNTEVKCCRFHFAQALWRKIGELGLTATFKDRASESGKWLHHFFGLPLLPNDLVESTFTDHLMAFAPNDETNLRFADYVLRTYVSPDALFPPSIWAWPPSDEPHTNNAAESFHAGLVNYFDSPHPNAFVFVNGLKQIQTGVYISLRSTEQGLRTSREKKDRRVFVNALFDKLRNGVISSYEYISTICYNYLPVVDI